MRNPQVKKWSSTFKGTQREHLGKRPKKQGMNKAFLNPFYIFWEIAGNNLSVPHS